MPRTLSIMGGTSPGSYYEVMNMLTCRAIEQTFPDVATRQVPGASVDCIYKVSDGTVDMGMSSPVSLREAYDGKGVFENKYQDVRIVCYYPTPGSGFTAVTLKDSPIESVYDVADKRVSLMSKGTASAGWFTEFLGYHGITPESIEANGGLVYYGSTSDAFELLASDRLDCVFFASYHPSKTAQMLNVQQGIKLIPYEEAMVDRFIEDHPGTGKGYLPPGTYEGQTEPYLTWTGGGSVICHKDMTEDVVYNLCAALYSDEGQSVFKEHSEKWAAWDWVDGAVQCASIPVHPGAVKYFKDRGLEFRPF